MIVIDPPETSGNSPSERSPLKIGELSPTTPLASGHAPPPPYAAAPEPVPAPVQSYQSVQSVPVHHQPYVQRPPTGDPFKRFLRAFLVAVIILVLWGVFLDSVDMAIGTSAGRHGQSQGMRISWMIKSWYTGSNSTRTSPCPCLDRITPTTPGRVLPIRYPPIVEASKLSALPIPCPSVLPEGEVEMLKHPAFLVKSQIKGSDPFIQNLNST